MAYRDDLQALGANHIWPCDGDLNDIVGTLNYTNSGGAFTGPAVCQDVSASYSTTGTNTSATATISNVQIITIDYCYSLWFRTNNIQQPPCRIFGDGGNSYNNSFFLGFDNSIVCEADVNTDKAQIGSNNALQLDRSYHLCLIFRDIGGGGGQLEFFLDGVSQGTLDVTSVSSSTRGGFRIGGITGTSTYSIGGVSFQLVSPVDGYYSMISTFVSSNVPTVSEVREELFEKGAIPGITIASGSAASIQTALDGLSASTLPDEPLNIRIEAVTGDGDFTLSSDNLLHNDLASIHVQYMGTGTLTWINLNGSNASIGSTPNGGTINFVNPASLTVSPLQLGSTVVVLESGTVNELASVSSSGASFTTTITQNTVDVIVHSLGYENVRVNAVDMSEGDVSVPISQAIDRQYENS